MREYRYKEVLKTLMGEFGLTSKEFGEELNMSPQSVYAQLHGKGMPNLATLMDIADYFEVTLDYLVYGAEEKEENLKKEYRLPEMMRDIMKKRKISKKKLMSDTSIAKNTVDQYLSQTNQPTLKIAIRLAEYFNVSLDYLVWGIK